MLDLVKYLLSQLSKFFKTPLGISVTIHILMLILLLCNFDFFNIKKEIKIPNDINVQVINEKMLKEKVQKIQKSAIKQVPRKQNTNQVKKDFSNLMQKLNNKKTNTQKSTQSKNNLKKENDSKLNNLLKNIERDKKKTKQLEQDDTSENYQLSDSDEEEIKKQIYQNWYIPSGIKNADQYVIDILIKINPDGSVFYTEILNAIHDRGFEIASASAERAIQLSSPLKITSEKLRHLKEFVIRFNMKEALRQI